MYLLNRCLVQTEYSQTGSPEVVLSTNLLRAATKFVYEPLRGVRAVALNLYKCAFASNPDFLTNCTRGNEFRRLFFALCIFHAILRERVLYGSCGSVSVY